LGKERDTNAALKAVRRAKYLLEQTKKSVPELQARIEEMKREVEKEESIEKKQRAQLEELKMDRDILLNNILKQEDIEKSTAGIAKHIIFILFELC
jgi:chromosome segregation ATPase